MRHSSLSLLGILVVFFALADLAASQERVYLEQGIHASSHDYPLHYSEPRYYAPSARSMGRYGPMIFESPDRWSVGDYFNWQFRPWAYWPARPSGRYRHYVERPAYDARPLQTVPTRDELAEMNQGQLRDALGNGLQLLDEQLGRFKTGPDWREYFNVPAVGRLIRREGNAPRESNAEELKKLLDRLELVGSNATYVKISSLSGFRTTHAALAEYLDRLPASDSVGTAESP